MKTYNYTNEYFKYRLGNDSKRIAQFDLDAKFIRQFIEKGSVCDVGCSTGEFLRRINWDGALYGMEVNDYAISLAKDIINFEKNIYTEKDFFDLVVFRGTIQHVENPFKMLREAYSSLKPEGYLCLLAVPNTSSPLYRLKQDLPFIEWDKVYYITDEKSLVNAIQNIGFKHILTQKPYLETPYCSIIKDHFYFLNNIFIKSFKPHAFWGSSLSIIFQK